MEVSVYRGGSTGQFQNKPFLFMRVGYREEHWLYKAYSRIICRVQHSWQEAMWIKGSKTPWTPTKEDLKRGERIRRQSEKWAKSTSGGTPRKPPHHTAKHAALGGLQPFPSVPPRAGWATDVMFFCPFICCYVVWVTSSFMLLDSFVGNDNKTSSEARPEYFPSSSGPSSGTLSAPCWTWATIYSLYIWMSLCLHPWCPLCAKQRGKGLRHWW